MCADVSVFSFISTLLSFFISDCLSYWFILALFVVFPSFIQINWWEEDIFDYFFFPFFFRNCLLIFFLDFFVDFLCKSFFSFLFCSLFHSFFIPSLVYHSFYNFFIALII